MENRRNYYRILQVQPDAPVEIIRTSYHALMKEMKKHPDLGGDDWTASVINEAYETLSDNNKREAYDRELFQHYTELLSSGKGSSRKTLEGFPCQVLRNSRQQTGSWICPFHEMHAEPAPAGTSRSNNYRSYHRIKIHDSLLYHVSDSGHSKKAQMQDLSPKGIRFTCREELPEKTVIDISCSLFRARARVVKSLTSTQEDITGCTAGAKFLSITFKNPVGTFYSGIA